MAHPSITRRTFDVDIPPEMRTLYPDASGAAELTCTVTNTSAVPVRAKLRIAPTNGTAREWLVPAQDEERDFRANEAQQFKVALRVPATPRPPAGTYGFRVDAANVANPQEDYTEGAVVAFAITPGDERGGETPQTNKTWLIVAATAVLLLLVGGAILAAILLRAPKVPSLGGKDLLVVEKELKDRGLALGEVSEGDKPDAPVGTVIAQSPQANLKAKKGDRVNVTMQLDRPEPRLEGKKLKDVQADVLKMGYELEIINVREGVKPPGTILRQPDDRRSSITFDALPGRPRFFVGPINIDVEADAQGAPMPSLSRQPLADATAKLAAANIAFKITPVLTPLVEPGQVLQQSKPANEVVNPTEQVELRIRGVLVPDINGMPLLKAAGALGSAKLTVGQIIGPEDGSVLLSEPSLGQAVLPGTRVHLLLRGSGTAAYPFDRAKYYRAKAAAMQASR
jgi:beta-lactam-binding protein with PASTA domain